MRMGSPCWCRQGQTGGVLRTLLLPVLLVLMWMRPMLLAAMALGVLLGSLPGSILHFYFVTVTQVRACCFFVSVDFIEG